MEFRFAITPSIRWHGVQRHPLASCSQWARIKASRLEKIGAFALTEPEHGSDSVSLETTATPDGRSYVINGNKKWIGNGSIADVVVGWARDTSDHVVKGFLVEKGTPGYNAWRPAVPPLWLPAPHMAVLHAFLPFTAGYRALPGRGGERFRQG